MCPLEEMHFEAMSYTHGFSRLIRFAFPGAADSLPPQLLRSLQRTGAQRPRPFFFVFCKARSVVLPDAPFYAEVHHRKE